MVYAVRYDENQLLLLGTLNGCADVEYDSATGPNASKNGSNDGIGETEENVDDPNVKWVSDFLIRKQVGFLC